MGEASRRPLHSDARKEMQRYVKDHQDTVLVLASHFATREMSPTTNAVHVRNAVRTLQAYPGQQGAAFTSSLQVFGGIFCSLGFDKYIDALVKLSDNPKDSSALVYDFVIFALMGFGGLFAILWGLYRSQRRWPRSSDRPLSATPDN